MTKLESAVSAARWLHTHVDFACVQYEAVLGPLILELERHRRALAAVFRLMVEEDMPPSTGDEIATALLPSLGHVLGGGPPPASTTQVLQAIASATAFDTSTPAGQLLGAPPRISAELAEFFQAMRPALSARFRDAVFNDEHAATVYDRLTQAAGSLLVSSPQVPADLPASSGAQAAAAVPPSPLPRQRRSSSATTSTDPSPARNPARRSAKDSKRRASSSAASSATPKMTRERLSRYQAVARAREQQRAVEIKRLRKAERLPQAPAWPRGSPHRLDLPTSVIELRQMAWRLSFLTTEQMVPDPRSYSTVIEDLGSYQVPLKEIAKVYAARPWEVITSPPNPRFPHDDRFPELARCVKGAREFYRKHAQVLWEQTHAFIPAATVAPFEGVWMTTSEYLKMRCDRNSKLTQPLTKHYARLSAICQFPGLDADFLLDPFHYWAPVYGALLVALKLHQSLADAVAAADLAALGRLYSRGPGGERAFIETIGLSQDRVAEIERKFAALSPAADVRLKPLPSGSPSLPAFGDGEHVDDESGDSDAGNATEVVSEAPGDDEDDDPDEGDDEDEGPRPPSKRGRTIVSDDTTSTAQDVVDLSKSPVRPARPAPSASSSPAASDSAATPATAESTVGDEEGAPASTDDTVKPSSV